MFVYELSDCGFGSSCSHLPSKLNLCFYICVWDLFSYMQCFHNTTHYSRFLPFLTYSYISIMLESSIWNRRRPTWNSLLVLTLQTMEHRLNNGRVICNSKSTCILPISISQSSSFTNLWQKGT